MRGNEGNDKLYGGPGNDTIYGGSGDDTADGASGTDALYGGPGHDRILDSSGENNKIYAGDGEQDLICVDRGSGEIVTSDPQDTFIFNRSC